jgi:hypothetical protein
MTEILLQIGEPGADKRACLKEIKSRLKAAFAKTRPCQSSRYVRDGYFRFLRAASKQVRGLSFWGWWFYR